MNLQKSALLYFYICFVECTGQLSIIYSGCFMRIFAYTQANFQPSLSYHFVERLTILSFIYQRYALTPALEDSQTLGAHSGVVEFHSDTRNPTLYTWSHPIHAPCGHRIIMQCQECKSLNSFEVEKISKNRRLIKHRCTFQECSFTKEYSLPSNAAWVSHAPAKSDYHGTWFKAELCD